MHASICPREPIVALAQHLRAPQRSDLGPHLLGCRTCRALLERLQSDERWLHELRAAEGESLDRETATRLSRIGRELASE